MQVVWLWTGENLASHLQRGSFDGVMYFAGLCELLRVAWYQI